MVSLCRHWAGLAWAELGPEAESRTCHPGWTLGDSGQPLLGVLCGGPRGCGSMFTPHNSAGVTTHRTRGPAASTSEQSCGPGACGGTWLCPGSEDPHHISAGIPRVGRVTTCPGLPLTGALGTTHAEPKGLWHFRDPNHLCSMLQLPANPLPLELPGKRSSLSGAIGKSAQGWRWGCPGRGGRAGGKWPRLQRLLRGRTTARGRPLWGCVHMAKPL